MKSRLPPIERWLPALSIEAKHALQSNLDGLVTDVVLQEIEELLGCSLIRSEHSLTESERDFIRTQTEVVD